MEYANKFTIGDTSKAMFQANDIIQNKFGNKTYYNFDIKQLYRDLAQQDYLYRVEYAVSQYGTAVTSLSDKINSLIDSAYNKAIKLDSFRKSMDAKIDSLVDVDKAANGSLLNIS